MGKYFKIYLLASLLFFWLPGCNNPVTEAGQQPAAPREYFNLNGFIQEQISLLQKEKPVAVKKVTEAGRRSETKKLTNLDWAEELGVFLELDLNKPAFRNAYTITRRQDAQTKDIILLYRRKPGTDGNIQYLEIKTDADGQVKAIRGRQESDNLLLSTRRELQLICQTVNGETRLTSYRIQGLQKPIIFQELRYVISTELV